MRIGLTGSLWAGATLVVCGVHAATTTGVYDENITQPNTVDFVAPGSTITAAQFAADIATAFAQDQGGVIGGGVLGAFYDFGVNESKTLRFRAIEGTNWGIGSPTSSPLPISGTSAFASSSGGGFDFTSFEFAEIINGEPNEQVVSFGITALSVDDRDYGNVTVTGRLASGGHLLATRQIAEPATLGDTFFGFAAPNGDHFTGFALEYDGAVVADVRLWFDDIGFITAIVPEPGSLLIALWARRR